VVTVVRKTNDATFTITFEMLKKREKRCLCAGDARQMKTTHRKRGHLSKAIITSTIVLLANNVTRKNIVCNVCLKETIFVMIYLQHMAFILI